MEFYDKKIGVVDLIAWIGSISLTLLYLIILYYFSKSATKYESFRIFIFGLFILASGLSFIFYFWMAIAFITPE